MRFGRRIEADAVRLMIGSWQPVELPPDTPDDRPVGGLDLPPADASAVIREARNVLALGGDPDPRLVAVARTAPGFAALCRISGALVVDEHPSVGGWSPVERRAVTEWVAVLIARLGAEGVERLVERLAAGR
ncbi:hypothetical protein AB0K51_26190 [Kitasatospora sp. NPDC049285]|uniref:hypothetical protein n=1 Tax=Kitasatospora sp. NPDC049285 TaxID=3157096 RepID=UPI003429D3DF